MSDCQNVTRMLEQANQTYLSSTETATSDSLLPTYEVLKLPPGSKIMTVMKMSPSTLAKDVKNELEAALDILAGKGKGAKGKAPRGLERKKMWEEVRALRKE